MAKIRYFCFKFELGNKPKLNEQRIEDNRILTEEKLIDFMYNSIYDDRYSIGVEKQIDRYLKLKPYDILANSKLFKIDDLKKVLNEISSLKTGLIGERSTLVEIIPE